MDDANKMTDDHPEVIKQQMEETRSSLTEKLEALESKLGETVQTTTDVMDTATKAVEATVETVKETVEGVTHSVQETVHSVSSAFSLSKQTERRPWLVMGVAFGSGCLLGSLAARRGSHSAAPAQAAPFLSRSRHAKHSNGHVHAQETQAEQQGRPERAQPEHESWFGEQLQSLKGLALATLLSTFRELVTRTIAGPVGQRIGEELDSLTHRFGAEPIRGPLFDTPPRRERQTRPAEAARQEAAATVGTETAGESNRFRAGGGTGTGLR